MLPDKHTVDAMAGPLASPRQALVAPCDGASIRREEGTCHFGRRAGLARRSSPLATALQFGVKRALATLAGELALARRPAGRGFPQQHPLAFFFEESFLSFFSFLAPALGEAMAIGDVSAAAAAAASAGAAAAGSWVG